MIPDGLLLASSSSNSTFEGKKHTVPDSDCDCMSKGQPLNGINKDIQIVKNYHGPFLVTLKSSTHQNCLLSIHEIKNKIKQFFNQQKWEILYLYYTGHGHRNGDWAVETQENKQADRISFEQIVQFWENKSGTAKGLFIQMDSCYSGNWCYRLKQMEKQVAFVIGASSSPDQYSWTGRNGGIYFNTIMSLCPPQNWENKGNNNNKCQAINKQKMKLLHQPQKQIFQNPMKYRKNDDKIINSIEDWLSRRK